MPLTEESIQLRRALLDLERDLAGLHHAIWTQSHTARDLAGEEAADQLLAACMHLAGAMDFVQRSNR